jgi:TonB family protein
MKRVRLSFAQGQLMLWILASSLLAVAAMFAFFRVNVVRHTTPAREEPRIDWMPAVPPGQTESNDKRYVVADVLDPSLMSLPSVHGFSRDAWSKTLEATQRDLGWNQEPAYLDAAPTNVTRSLLEPVSLASAALSTAEKNPAQSEEPVGEPTISPVTVNESVFRVLGPLEERAVLRAPELPVLSSPVPIRPVQVRVGVGADGRVSYALVDRSCGDETVDTQAVQLARQIRFEPEENSVSLSLSWGIVRFLWATQAPATTNAEAAAVPP